MKVNSRIIILLFAVLYGIAARASKEDSLKALLKTANDTQQINLYYKLGYATKDFQAAKEYFSKAYRIADSLKNDKKLFRIYSAQGNVYEKNGELDEALKFYFSALEKATQLHDSDGIGDMNLDISWLYFELQKYELAEQYGKAALQIYENRHDEKDIANAYNNLATYKKDAGKYEDALKLHQQALEIRIRIKDAAGMSHTYNNIGLVYLKMEKYPETIEYLEKSYHIKDSLHDVKGMAGSLINISNAYIGMKKFQDALDYALRGTKLADSAGHKIFLKNGYQAVAESYKGLGMYEQALDWMQKYISLKDKLVNEENIKQVNELQAKYKSDTLSRRIEMLNVKSALQETELANSQMIIYGISGVTVLLLASGFFIFRGYREKKRALVIISSIRDNLEQKNQEISDSINYAKNIQRSLLPDPEQLSKVFSESFVLNLPKDIVSGDFFSLAHKGEKAYLAVADCTGHGVPGAFMSMLGTDKLTQAIQDSATGMPGEILSLLNHAVKSSLHQHDQKMLSKDGMDIALLCFDNVQQKVWYAGANRPLWIVRNGAIVEYKPAKAAIGGTTPDTFLFPDNAITLEKGDVLYLFSDGYADQFGGVKGKKLMTRHFRELLLHAYQQPFELQREFLLGKLKEWQGNFEQVDDILVVGVRV